MRKIEKKKSGGEMTFEFLIGRGVKEEKIRGDWRRGDEDDFQSRFSNLSIKKTFLLFRWTIMFQTRTTSISAYGSMFERVRLEER